MIGASRRQDLTSSNICSTSTTVSSNARFSDLSSRSSFSPTLISPQRPILKSARRCIIPFVPSAWSPVAQVSPRAALRDFCISRQEPRTPTDVLNRSTLSSCSPSLAKFSRTSIGHHVPISTSPTTLPSTINTVSSLPPTMAYLTVTGLKLHHPHRHHPHHQYCRHTR